MLDVLLAFIALKLVGAVDWSWGVVFIPLWVGIIEEICMALFTWWLGLDM